MQKVTIQEAEHLLQEIISEEGRPLSDINER